MVDKNKATPKSLQKLNSDGFTLIEIAIAIFILATGLVIILGLQTATVSRSIDDRLRLQAMLIARRVLTGLETGDVEPKDQETSQPALEYLSTEDIRPEDEEMYKKFTVNLNIGPWEIPGYDDLKVKRIFVKIAWGDKPEQSVPVFYFVPDNEEESAQPEPSPGTAP
ncbi:MAG: prepilin-type N-terminal cleavage/methylation domain-containing protein [bacterium]|nr:prepilin-type N-terminal cleavage/methylation domain-containing protein [bacterium]